MRGESRGAHRGGGATHGQRRRETGQRRGLQDGDEREDGDTRDQAGAAQDPVVVVVVTACCCCQRRRGGGGGGGGGGGALQEAHGHRSRQAHHRPRYLRLRVLARPVEPLQPCFLFGFVLSKGVAGTIQLILF